MTTFATAKHALEVVLPRTRIRVATIAATIGADVEAVTTALGVLEAAKLVDLRGDLVSPTRAAIHIAADPWPKGDLSGVPLRDAVEIHLRTYGSDGADTPLIARRIRAPWSVVDKHLAALRSAGRATPSGAVWRHSAAKAAAEKAA